MLQSIALLLLSGLFLGFICSKIRIPALLGMIVAGMIAGPYGLNLLDGSILDISAQIRQIALIIILTRAGLNLDINDIKKVGRPAILLSFVPATFEIIGTVIFAPMLFGITIYEALLLGSVIAAVSPAVVVPKMLELMEKRYGTKEGIPQMILAAASVDDIYVIILFSIFTSLVQTGNLNLISLFNIPLSIGSGILIGILAGVLLKKLFQIGKIKDMNQFLVTLSVSFLLVYLETILKDYLAMSGYLAIMSMGIVINQTMQEDSKLLAKKYTSLWAGAQIFLFTLVGASVNLDYALKAGPYAVLLIVLCLCVRMCGVLISLLKTRFNRKERAFCMLAYTPKATVQAAIGGIALSLGLACGELVLSIAVVSILITAPFGAFAMDLTYQKFLKKEV